MSTLVRKLILPGQYCVADTGMILETLVGSCVAVCLWNTKKHLAAMNHFLLPHPPANLPATCEFGQYGTLSTEYIILQMLQYDTSRRNIKAAVFGGGAVLRNQMQDRIQVGDQNLDVAQRKLENFRIPVIRREIGGNRGRRIYFNTETFEINVRFSGDISRKRTQVSDELS